MKSLILACLLQANPGQDAERSCFLTADEANLLRNSPTMDTCVQRLKAWKRAHAFEKLAFVEELGRRFKDDEKITTLNYTWEKGTNDYRRLAGRINWALGEMLGVRLAPVGPGTSAEELEKLSQEASRLVTAYRAGVMSAAAERKESAVEDLKRKYAGKIQPGITDRFIPSAAAMHDLLVEWFPVGKEIRSLAEIVGSPGMKEEGRHFFNFENGFVGVSFQFEVREGRIDSLSLLGID